MQIAVDLALYLAGRGQTAEVNEFANYGTVRQNPIHNSFELPIPIQQSYGRGRITYYTVFIFPGFSGFHEDADLSEMS
jgi:hypothetical protein